MTRAPRSRKKKAAATLAPAVVAQTATPAQSLDLPLPALDAAAGSAPETDETAVMPVESAASAPTAADDAIASDPMPAASAGVAPSRMTVEVTEDRGLLGQRLRAAREARGWSREDVAHRLHVPTTVVADIEAQRFERLGAPIYVRGYLSKYAQLLGLPMVVVNRALEGMNAPDLRASTEAAPLPNAWDRHKVTVIGGLITLAVATSVVTLVANRGIHAPVPQVRSLDESEMTESMATLPVKPPAAPVADLAATDVVTGSGFESATTSPSSDAVPASIGEPAQPVSAPVPSAPVMASMATFPPAAPSGLHVLEARFREDSWIEIFDADGRVIEQNLVRAGQSRRYESTGAVSIKIGNVGGVDVRADGNPIDLAPHARANVARLRLFEPAAASPTP